MVNKIAFRIIDQTTLYEKDDFKIYFSAFKLTSKSSMQDILSG